MTEAVTAFGTSVLALVRFGQARWRESVGKDKKRAREILGRLLGVVRLVRERGGLFAELSTSPGQLLGLAAGCDGSGGRIAQLPTLASALIFQGRSLELGMSVCKVHHLGILCPQK
jgi:hypothetical protein